MGRLLGKRRWRDHRPRRASGDGYHVTISPAIGENGRKRLVGCLEDGKLGRVTGDSTEGGRPPDGPARGPSGETLTGAGARRGQRGHQPSREAPGRMAIKGVGGGDPMLVSHRMDLRAVSASWGAP